MAAIAFSYGDDRPCRQSFDRAHSQAHDQGPEREGQQQVLGVYFAGIHDNINQLLSNQIKRLNYRYEKTKDSVAKQELDRLKTKLEQLAGRWDFRSP
jgi:hypothetical protein